jgi:hypothetical protein
MTIMDRLGLRFTLNIGVSEAMTGTPRVRNRNPEAIKGTLGRDKSSEAITETLRLFLTAYLA